MPKSHPARTAAIGVAFACLSTTLGGMTVALTRLIIAETEPLSLTFIRYGIGAIVLLGFMLWTLPIPRFARRDWPGLILLSLVMFSVFPFFMARGLADTTAARGGLLFATMPMITMLMGAAFRVEAMSWAKTAGVVLTLLGGWVALGETVADIAPNALRGDAYMLAGLIAASSFNVFSKRYLTRYGSLPVITVTMFIGVAGLLALALIFEQPFSGDLDFDLNGWFIVAMLGIPGAAIMLGAWGRALHMISPTRATITIGLNPLTAILMGAWLLSEPMTARVFVGFALIVAAILVANIGPARSAGVETLS